MKPRLPRAFASPTLLARWLRFLGLAVGLTAAIDFPLPVRAAVSAPATPVQGTYDVWGGNVLDLNKFYYDVDKFDFVKLGTASRTATFQGRYNYYVVAVRKTEYLFLDAAQSTTGSYYQGSFATGNTDNPGNAMGAPDGRYTVLKGPAIGSATSTYGSFGIFYNPGSWTGITLHVYSAPSAPNFTLQPESQTAGTGTTVQLSVATTGDAPIKYQWFKNGQSLANGGRISGAMSSNLTFTGIQPADAGTYSVLASNARGSATSKAAVLEVATPPSSFTLLDYFHPVAEGNEWTYSAVDEGQSGEHVVRMEDVAWESLAWTGRGSPRSYVTNLVRLSRTFFDPQSHQVISGWIEHFGTDGQLSYWGNDEDDEIGRVDGGLPFPSSVALGQTVKVTRDYYENGVYLEAVTVQFTVANWGSVTVPAGRFEDCLRLRVIYARGGRSGGYEEWWARGVGAVKRRHYPDTGEEQLDLSSYRALSKPQITLQPRGTSAAEGTPVSFAVAAVGTEPLRYQWRKNGVDLPGQTSASLAWPSMRLSDVGDYSVVIANDLGRTVSAVATLTLGAERIAPQLVVTSPVDSLWTAANSTVVAGTASDAGRGGSGILSVKVNGVRAQNDTASGSGTAAWSRTVALTSGWNTLSVVATDGSTNAITNIVRVMSDPQKPSIVLSTPTPNQRLDLPTVTATGTSSDNQEVVAVRFQINGADWMPATAVTPALAKWSASLALQPGPNTLKAYAEDAAGNRSPTNSVTFTYVVSAPLTLVTNGLGSVNPNLGGQRLEIGKSYTFSASPRNGFSFARWTSNKLPESTKPSLTFAMVEGLAITAHFVDTTKPTIAVAAPTANQRLDNSSWTARGTASDNDVVARVLLRLNGGDWVPAHGTTAWTRELALVPGPNTLLAYAED
ncbi:MAG: immunoglobulin domain-containing protein, partial [Verrucomicrobiales bacterium]|nr:immunoglobulin domain-containing protein [Verrucomicrobiales bacterium]